MLNRGLCLDRRVLSDFIFVFSKMKRNGQAKSLFSFVLLFVLGFISVSSFIYHDALIANGENLSGVDYDEISVDFNGHNEGYSAVLYNNSNGLPTSEANAIAETDEGFIWIGSYSGLIRYDGNTFERVDSTTGVTSVVCLYVDSKNRLWIGTNDNGLAVLDKGKYTVFSNGGTLQSFSVRCITEDAEGNIYVATTHGMGVVGEDMTIRQFNEPQLNDAYIEEIRKDENTGIIYGVIKDGSVFTIENGKLTGFYTKSGLGINKIHSILPDPKNPGHVYIGTSASEVYYGNLAEGMTDKTLIDVSPLNGINSMEYVDKKLWICSDKGIGIRDYTGFRKIDNLTMNNSIDEMLTDYEGNLWFTSSRQGVMKIVRNQFTDIFDKYDLEEEVVNTTCKYKNYLLIGSDSGLVAVEGGSRAKFMRINEMHNVPDKYSQIKNLLVLLDGVRIRSIKRDSNGAVWISTYSDLGLIKYDDGAVTSYNEENGMPSDNVRTVYEGKNGRMLCACSGGVAVIDNGDITVYDDTNGLENEEILTVVEGYNNEIIVGTNGGGMYVIKEHEVKHFAKEDGLQSQVVMRIKRDDKKRLYWIVTSNSISYMTESFNIVTINKFPYSNNFDLYINSKEEIWVLSSNGVYVVDEEQMLANEVIEPVFYSMHNGLSCVTTPNSYSELSDNGDLYISGSTGVAKVNIENKFEKIDNVKMAVPYVEADGEFIYPDEKGVITVPAENDRVTVYGYIFNYSLVNPKVTYYLEGFDKSETTVDRTEFKPVAYTNLRGKTYQFVMILHDSMGRGDNELKVTIVKEKAYYEKITFMIAMLIVAGLFVFLIVKKAVNAKTKALVKKQNENKLFIREMTEAFARTIDMKDRYTKGHSTRVADYTALLTRELGYDEETIEKYYNIALLHDIGKIAIKPEVLNKAGKLTDEEFTLIKSHSTYGYNVLKDISIMPELAHGAHYHHERPDGHGYPEGLKGEKIPRVAQIIAVADTFDAMYSDRPYRKRMNFDKVVSIIKEVSGTQLAEDVVDAFLRLVEQGEFRDPKDDGGGTTEDINNIRKKFEESK